MEELMPEIPTASNSSSSFKPPEPDSIDPNQIRDPFELNESDVVWSFSISSDSYPHPTSAFPSPPPHHRRRPFNPAKSGLSVALSDDPHRLVSRKSNPRVITPATRREDAAANFHRSAPVTIPVWPENLCDRYSKRLVEMEDEGEVNNGEEKEEEMVPPHVIVARSHVTFSVFEGAGRTLKGRDLRRLRNTVFQKTGFID